MACSGSAACGTAPAPVCMRGGRRHGLLRGVSSPRADRRCPGTTSWWPTFAGCSKPRRFMVRATEKRQAVGEAAGRGNAHLEGAGAPVDARARPPSPAGARATRMDAEGARWDHHHRDSRRDVGHRHDGHRDRRRGGSRRLRGRRSLLDRVHRAPCRQVTETSRWPLRGPAQPMTAGAFRERFGGIGAGVAHGLRLRHDHGSNYLADDFQQEVAFFGIESSPSVRAGARRQRRRGALHSHAEASSLCGRSKCLRGYGASRRSKSSAWLCLSSSGRPTSTGCWRIRLPKPGPGATRPPRAGRGGVEANTVKPLSKNPEAVQSAYALDASTHVRGERLVPRFDGQIIIEDRSFRICNDQFWTLAIEGKATNVASDRGACASCSSSDDDVPRYRVFFMSELLEDAFRDVVITSPVSRLFGTRELVHVVPT